MRKTMYISIGLALCAVAVAFLYVWTHTFNSETTMPSTSTNTPGGGTLKLLSEAFSDGEPIPMQFTCDGAEESPPLSISGVPAPTKTLALVVDDPDVPKQLRPDGVFDHWVLFNILPTTTGIPAGGTVGISGVNSAGKNAYAPPCPPPQYEPSEHRYVFTLYALDTQLALSPGASKADVLRAMEGHILDKAVLVGRYKRN